MPAGLPTAILVEVEFTAGVWTDIATSVVGDSIEIRVGRESAGSDVQPGTLSLTLDNFDGQWTPDNATSARYPNWVEGKRIRVRVTKGTTSTRFVGRITAIVPDFPTVPWSSRVQVSAVDLLGDLAGVELSNPLRSYLDSLNTIAVYPLDDVNGRSTVVESRSRVRQMAVRNVSTGGAVEFAGSEYLGSPAVSMTAGKGLAHQRFAFIMDNGTSQGVSMFVCVFDNSYGEVLALTTGPRDGAIDGLLLRWTSSGFVLDDLAAGVVVSSTSAVAADPGWHWVHFAGTTGGSMSLYVDNDIRGFTDTSTVDYTCLSIGGSVDMAASMLAVGPQVFDSIGMFSSTVSFLGWPDLITDSGFAIFDNMSGLVDLGGKTTFTGSIESARTYAPVQTDSTTALDYLLRIANSLGGLAYHEYSTNATQSVVFPTAATLRPTTVAITIDAALDLNGGPTLDRTNVKKGRAVEVTSPIDSIVVQDASQVGSTTTIDTFLGADYYLRAVGEDALARSASTRLRVSQMTVDLSTASNDLYASLWGLTLGERVRLSNLPSTYFGVTYMDGYVEGWTERPGVTGYEVTFDLSPADAPSEGLWDDSTYGRWGFGDGVATNSSSATSGATSVQFQWTGGLTLSTSAGDYPLDLDWNGERVTVNSAPAGGSSPQTLSITRGVAPTVARAHNAGETVDIWNAARWAM